MKSKLVGYNGEYNDMNQRHGYGILRQELHNGGKQPRFITIEGEWEFGLICGTATVSVDDKVVYNGTWTDGFMDDTSSFGNTSGMDLMQVRHLSREGDTFDGI